MLKMTKTTKPSSSSIPFRIDLFSEGRQNKSGRVTFPGSVSVLPGIMILYFSSRWLLHMVGWVFPACFTGLGSWIAYHPSIGNCGAQKPLYMGVLYLLILVPVIIVFLINIVIFCKASSSGW